MNRKGTNDDAAARIENLRERIDSLDEKVQALISERARLALKIAETKQREGGNNFYRPEREAGVLRRVLARNKGPLTDEAIARLFREVESGNAHFGLVPIENSTEGVINHTLDMFLTSPLKICGEVELRIHHHLLGKGNDPHSAKRVVSHQQSLAQCREWLDANLPGIERVTAASNAEAARMAAADVTLAAIAGDTAARLYGLKIFANNIEDRPDNTTRFLVIGTADTAPSGNDKTSLLLSSRNRPGALQRLLTPLAKNGINMTRIESRPSHQSMWEYVFFIDVDGHVKDRKVAKALAELEKEAAFLKRLGSYPKAVL